ncbi:hypothetical protein OESDEN_07266 [Oesophagostomum dentatum]|uniref:Uncharacterized protein n=1 Tax=Oesophagostomum dentatum TaxID=61180 RepID=A0A0B1T9K9_OESDE|nr:hypothetical protein OESDEN_07266 [Oesophagostomum dentatum]
MTALPLINEQLKQQYANYRECIRRREEVLSESNYVQVSWRSHSSKHLRNRAFKLKISDRLILLSVSPENAVEIESTYKPSAGTIGRAFKKAVDFFKERILRLSSRVRDTNLWKYDWQRAIMGQDWRPLTKMHEAGMRVEKIADKVKRFLARDRAKVRVGDRYELRLTAVDRNATGYYRCVNKHGKNRVVSSMYYLDVISRVKIKMVKSKLNEIPASIPQWKKEIGKNLVAKMVASPWSECSKCGEEIGEQARSVQCMIEVFKILLFQSLVPLSHLVPESSWIQLFGTVPCYSTLVPLDLRYQFASSTIYVQYRPCWRQCTTQTAKDRNLTSVDELGERRVLDYIPKGEFLFGEILPRLTAPVVRRGHLVEFMLLCSLIIDRYRLIRVATGHRRRSVGVDM